MNPRTNLEAATIRPLPKPLRAFVAVLLSGSGLVVLSALLHAGCTQAQAPAVRIQVGEEVVLASPERLGVNLGPEAYYGDQQYVENPFLHGAFSKGHQSMVMRIKGGTANSFSDADFDAADPDRSLARSLAGGRYTVATGLRRGESGQIAAHDLATGTLTVSQSGTPFADDDYVWLYGPDSVHAEPAPSDPNVEEGLGIGDFRVVRAAGVEFALVESDLGSTDQFLRVSFPSDATEHAAGIKHYLRATPDTAYRVRVRARSVIPGARLAVSMSNFGISSGDGNYVPFVASLGDALGPEWKDFIFDGRTPANNAVANSFSGIEMLAVATNAGGGIAAVEIDAVRLEDLRLQSDTAFSRQIVNTLKEARPGTLRFYTVADIAVPMRYATANSAGEAGWTYFALKSGYRFGNITATINECLALSRTVGARPWITVGNGNTPDEWAALISYLAAPAGTDADAARRVEQGQTEPWTTEFDRIYLEIGNEWWNPIFYPFHVNQPDKYGELCNTILERVLAHPNFDPNRIKLVIGGWAINAQRWNEVADATAQGHHYLSIAPYVVNDLDRANTDLDKYGTLFAAVDAYLREGGASTQQALKNNGKSTRLAVYELNTHITGGSASVQAASEICTSVAAGVAVLDQAVSLMSNLGASPVNYFVLLQRDFDGRQGLWGNLIREADGALRPRPVWHGLRLANLHFIDGDLVRTTVTGGATWNQAANGNVPEMSDVPTIHAYACISRDDATGKRRANVLLINRDLSRPASASVTLPFTAREEVAAITLSGNDLSANNETSEVVSLHQTSVRWPGPETTMLIAPCSATVLQFTES